MWQASLRHMVKYRTVQQLKSAKISLLFDYQMQLYFRILFKNLIW